MKKKTRFDNSLAVRELRCHRQMQRPYNSYLFASGVENKKGKNIAPIRDDVKSV